MSNNDNTHRTELPKIVDDGINNNYGEWETKSYHKMREWNLLKYIEGPASQPPTIPLLREESIHSGLDENDHVVKIRVPGNLAEHEQAVKNADPWMTGNNTALARIVSAVPSNQLHLVKRAKYAKNAWDSLRSVYRPRNSMRAATIKGHIMAYRCQSDMDVAKWLSDMQVLHNSLCDLDTEHMSDRDFALAIIDLMPQDEGWREFLSGLRTKVRDSDALGTSVDSITFIGAIREEYWHRHRDDYQTTSHIFSARFEAQKRNAYQKRPFNATNPSSPTTTQNKHARTFNPDNIRKLCTNSHCGAPRGHDTADCIAYKGAKEGKYRDGWRGPWNIHLPPSQRTKDNNVPPKTHPSSARLPTPSINQSHATDCNVSRSTTAYIQADTDMDHVNSALTSDPISHVWSTHVDDDSVVTTLPVLNQALAQENSFHYDSGANRHVFHDRDAFDDYESITPLTVKGFGHNLSTVAIGKGSVRLEARYGPHTSPILLRNVLHIPAARSNLISGVQLDKAGVVSTLGNKSITLSVNGRTIVGGRISNDMYRLDLKVLCQKSPALASRIAPLPLVSRLAASVATPHPPPADFYTA
jgi:gag-polypeptide of LTR copia-type